MFYREYSFYSHITMKKNILFLTLFLSSSPLLAQTPFWHQTGGPEGGTVENITIDSAGRVIVWTAGSGAFRSTDNGNSWDLLNSGLPSPQLYIGAATPNGYLIAANAAASGQLFRYNENDPNAQWEEITPYADTVTVTINDIVADPNGEIYLATGNHGLLRSDDNGTTWLSKGILSDTFRTKPPVQFDDIMITLSIDGNGNLFAGLAITGAIYRSSDRGESWKKLPALFDSLHKKQLSTLLAAPNGNIIVGSIQPTLTIGGYIYVSTDTGRSWKSVYQRPATSEEQKNNIDKLIRVPGTNVIYANAHGPTLRSVDDGLTWVIQDTDKRGDEVFSMAAKDTNFFQMCEPDGIFLSNDNGVSWTVKNKGVYAEYMYGVAINSKQSIFGITEYGLWGSTDNGDSWDHKPEYGEDYHPSLWIDKVDNIFIGTNKGLFRSKDDGQTLKHIIIHVPDTTSYITDSLGGNTILQVGDDGKGKLFCSSSVDSIGFLYSLDEGDHWVKIPKLPQQQQSILTFAFASADTIIVTSGSFGVSLYYLSTDDGVTWRLLSNSPSNPLASQSLIHPDGSYLARVRGTTGGIYRSVDLAKTWARIFPAEGVNVSFKDYLYMMIDNTGSIIVCTDSGVYRSTDASFSLWYSISDGLSANDVPGHFVKCSGMVENPVTQVFFAASQGLGVFKTVRSLGVSNDHAMPIAPSLVSTYPNPFRNETMISFTLPRRENISLEATDMLGRKVQGIFQGIFDEGVHNAVFDGSALPSGNYMITLRNEDGSYTSWVTLLR